MAKKPSGLENRKQKKADKSSAKPSPKPAKVVVDDLPTFCTLCRSFSNNPGMCSITDTYQARKGNQDGSCKTFKRRA